MLDRLEQAFALQREFVSDAGHELRTPITIIRGHLQLLDRDPETYRIVVGRAGPDEPLRGGPADAERIPSGPTSSCCRELDLDLLTEELMAKATRLGPREWKLEATGAGLLRGDRQRLTQAVMNLAAQRRPAHRGGRRDHGSAPRTTARQARIWVADAGPGVPEEDRERDLRAVRRASGTGLGPRRIVRTIAIAHGGRVELDEQRRRQVHDRAAGVVQTRILIAEDEPRIAAFLDKGLRANGFA